MAFGLVLCHDLCLNLSISESKIGPSVHGKLVVVAAICKHPRGKSEFYRVSICLSSIHWLPLHHMRSYVDYCLLSHAVARRADQEAHHGFYLDEGLQSSCATPYMIHLNMNSFEKHRAVICKVMRFTE